MSSVAQGIGPLFLPFHLGLLSGAVATAEDIVSDFFGLTSNYWVKNPYEVKTLRDETPGIMPEGTYAHLSKFETPWQEKISATGFITLYRIVIFDNRVLKATGGRTRLIMPFLVYVMTHELIHILRFSRFECAVDAKDKEKEEETVHLLTNKVLGRIPIPFLDRVIGFFKGDMEKLT